MYYAMRASAPSLHRESTDSLIHTSLLPRSTRMDPCLNQRGQSVKVIGVTHSRSKENLNKF